MKFRRGACLIVGKENGNEVMRLATSVVMFCFFLGIFCCVALLCSFV